MDKPYAWSYELATSIHSDGTYSRFDTTPRLSFEKPCVPEGSIRNLTPLYTRAAPPAMDREAVARLQEALERADGHESQAAMVKCDDLRAALSTLSADAIRQGEGMRALSDRATPGPWSWEQCGEKEDVPVVGIAFPGDDPDCKSPYEGEFRDSDASRMTIAFDWPSCDGHSPSANAAFAVAAVNFVRKLLATPASHASDGGKA